MNSSTTQKPATQKGSSVDHSSDNLSQKNKERKRENNSHLSSPQGQLDASGGISSGKSSVGLTNFHKISILPRSSTTLQPKLKINSPNDKFEQEADRVADRVMRMPVPKLSPKRNVNIAPLSMQNMALQRKCSIFYSYS